MIHCAFQWEFTSQNYSDAQGFNQALKEYQKQLPIEDQELMDRLEQWCPDYIVCPKQELELLYNAWLADQSELLPNESINKQAATDLDQLDLHEKLQVDITAKLRTDNPQGFTLLELFYKTQQTLRAKDLGANVYFEDFIIATTQNACNRIFVICSY